jgi:hypothetical protein
MDLSARVTMKDAAKCDKRCEWQNSANQKKAERILHFQFLLEVCLLQGVDILMRLKMLPGVLLLPCYSVLVYVR